MEFKYKNTNFLLLVFAFIFIAVYFFSAKPLELRSYNILNKLTILNKKADSNIVLVAIDDKSLYDIGRWPWKREYYLEIFDFLENYTQAKLMGYDGLIMAPDTNYPESDEKFFSKIGDFKKLTGAFAFSYDEFENKQNNYNELLKEKTDIKVIDKRSKKYKTASGFKSFTVLLGKYFNNVKSVGFVNIPEDVDGYIRSAAQLINYNNEFYPSLALSMYSKYTDINEFILTDKYLYGFSNTNTLKAPIHQSFGFISNYIYYYKTYDNTYSHKKFPASDVINSYRAIKKGQKPLINPDEFKDKVVFIGANAQAQALSDTARTPVSESLSGLDLQATNFDNLVNNNFYKTAAPVYNILVCLFVFLLVIALVIVLPIVNALLASTLVGFLHIVFSIFMYQNKIAINLILPLIYIFIAICCAYSYKYLIEGDKKEKIQKAMGKYLSYDIMKNVVENIDNVALGGKKADVTVLFADIRNFTSISEKMSANSVTAILNEYFSAMVPIIEEHNGILNKFMGDAVLAIFGEPKKSENHALDAVKCAHKMLKKVKMLSDKWQDEGKPKIEIGIGISTGEVFIGNIGSQNRLEYTVIGDTVNTASRIENFNKVYKTNFLISESSYERVFEHVDAITIKNVIIRGKAKKINIYEIIRLKQN